MLGEGNFTFAAAMASRHPSLALTASSLESEADSRALWGAAPALAALDAAGNATRLHGVDATRLEASPLAGQRFDRVLFTFPHGGAKGRIHVNRALLAGFARSVAAAGVLAPGGAVECCLAAGQGGTPVDGDALRSAPGDSWQLGLQAAEGGLVLAAAEAFDDDAWRSLGYASAGCWRGLGRPQPTREHGFRARAGVCHTLLPEGAPAAVSPWPARFDLDISLWVGGDRWPAALAADAGAAQALADAVAAAAGAAVGADAVAGASVVNLWVRPADGRTSLCVRLHYCSAARAMTQARAVAMHDSVRAALPAALPVQLRTRADALQTA